MAILKEIMEEENGYIVVIMYPETRWEKGSVQGEGGTPPIPTNLYNGLYSVKVE